MASISSSKSVTKKKPVKAAHDFKRRGAKKAQAALTNNGRGDPFDLIAAELRYYIDQQVRTIIRVPQEPSTRHLELHPSSFPYCGLRHAYRTLLGIDKEDMDYYGEYYTSLGTLKHELMQKYLGRGRKVLGDWVCQECGKKVAFRTYAPCPKCKSDHMKYEELGIKFGKWTHGHIDGVIKIDGKWFVVDYKTTSTKKNAEHKKKAIYPYKYNVAQISSYCSYLEALYDIEIEGWILIYVSRDSSFRDYQIVGKILTKKEKKAKLELLERYDRHFGKVMKLRDEIRLKYFKSLVLEKPCASMAQYKEEMHSYDWCELAKDGTCFDKSRLRIALQNLVNKKEGKPQVVAEL